jgi:antitoxin component of MazEF toxin-antitoxin module
MLNVKSTSNRNDMGTLHIRKLIKIGHSIAICLPPGWLAWYGLKQGDKVQIKTNGKLTIEAEPKSKTT